MKLPSDIQTYKARATYYRGLRGPWIEHLIEDEGLDFSQALRALQDWELIPYIDSKHGHMATLLKRNKEVHVAAYRCFRKKGHVTTTRLLEFFKPILEKEVFLVTKLAPGEDSRFIEHLGFQPLGVTIDGVKTYILNEIQFPRAAQCKQ